MLITARANGINWTWFLTYEPLPGHKIRILRHWREHHGESKTTDDGHTFQILEKGANKWGNKYAEGFDKELSTSRIADRVIIDNDWEHPLTVVNPKYVFDYR